VPSDAPLDGPEIAKPATGPAAHEQTNVPTPSPRDPAHYETALVPDLRASCRLLLI
jgi:hypothetical protein